MNDIYYGMFEFIVSDKLKLKIFFHQHIKQDLVFNFSFYEDSFYPNHPYKNLLKDFLDSYNKDSEGENHNLRNKEFVNSIKKDRINEKNIIEDLIVQNSSKDKISCIKCRVSYMDLHKSRGSSGFMMPILKEGNKNAYICDLCLMGW